MNKLLQISFLIAFSIILIGCSFTNTNTTAQSEKSKDSQDYKKVNIENKNCNKYRKIMSYASTYIKKEFEEGYFSKKDIVGAKAQLFLIESNSPTIFAKNINAANKSYTLNYDLAKKSNCNLHEFSIPPLIRLKNTIKSMKEKKDK